MQSMSQDTGNELNGRFTALQMAGEEIKAIMLIVSNNLNTMLANSGTANSTLNEIRSLAILAVGYLEDIKKNTKELYQMNERLGNIENNTKKL